MYMYEYVLYNDEHINNVNDGEKLFGKCIGVGNGNGNGNGNENGSGDGNGNGNARTNRSRKSNRNNNGGGSSNKYIGSIYNNNSIITNSDTKRNSNPHQQKHLHHTSMYT